MRIVGETVPIQIHVNGDDIDLTQASEIIVTFKQKQYEVEFQTADVSVDDADHVTVQMTQIQALGFDVGLCKVQINWMQNGDRVATKACNVNMLEQLHMEVI